MSARGAVTLDRADDCDPLTESFSVEDAERIIIADDDGLVTALRQELVERKLKLEAPGAPGAPRADRLAALRVVQVWLSRTKQRLDRDTRRDLSGDLAEIRNQNVEIIRLLRLLVDRAPAVQVRTKENSRG